MRINTYVKPNSKHYESVELLHDGTYEVHVKAPAVEGKANDAVKVMLASFFAVAKGNIRLIRGSASRHKVFDIKNITKTYL